MRTFRDTMIVNAPPEQVFDFYVHLKNLARMVPSWMNMRVVKAETPLRLGSRIRFGVRPRGIPFEVTWDAKISEFERGKVFTDRQIRGPFDHWVHRHEFRALEGNRTELTDTIEVGAPMGMLGFFLEETYFSHKIESVFEHRRRVLRSAFEGKPRV